jgi:hypothetical protein
VCHVQCETTFGDMMAYLGSDGARTADDETVRAKVVHSTSLGFSVHLAHHLKLFVTIKPPAYHSSPPAPSLPPVRRATP